MSLEEAESDLQETEWDRYITQQSQLLDTLYTEYETILNTRLDDIDLLLNQVIDGINAAAGAEGTLTSALSESGAIAVALGNTTTTIKDTLVSETSKVGTTLSQSMSSIWDAEGAGNKVITKYGAGFQQQQTTTNITLDNIKADVDSMAKKLGAKAQEEIEEPKTQPSSVADPTKGNNGNNGNKGSNNGDKKPNKPTVTDDTIKGIAAAIWIYGKNSGWGNNPFRGNKLKDKIGVDNAKKVQDYINKHGANGDLYKIWVQKGKNLDKYKYNAFASGKQNILDDQLAWTQEKGEEFIVRPSDGAILTPVAKGDSVLNATASGNIWSMANNPAEFIKNNLGLDSANIPNGANVNNTYSQHIDNVVFRMDNIKNYDEMLAQMQKDKNFERLVLSMSIDRLAGKSGLAKGKSIR